MFDIFVTALNAILPIVLLILLGYFLKKIKLLNENFFKTGNKLVFRILLPCMLFINVYDSIDGFSSIQWSVVAYSVSVICVIFGLGLVTAVLTTKKPERRGVILQCTFRSNFAVIGLSLVERLGGDSGLGGVVSAFSIPLFNMLAVVALSLFVREEKVERVAEGEEQPVAVKTKYSSAKYVLLNIVKNPLIIGVALGFVCVGIREIERACCGEIVFALNKQLKFLYVALKDLKAIASPTALIVLGGQFEFSAMKGMTKEIVVGICWRVVIAPLIGIGVAILISKYTGLFTFGKEVYPTLIALFASPVAVSSAIMAGEMKNDEQLATQLVVWTSIVSIVTIFIIIVILMSGGFLSL